MLLDMDWFNRNNKFQLWFIKNIFHFYVNSARSLTTLFSCAFRKLNSYTHTFILFTLFNLNMIFVCFNYRWKHLFYVWECSSHFSFNILADESNFSCDLFLSFQLFFPIHFTLYSVFSQMFFFPSENWEI